MAEWLEMILLILIFCVAMPIGTRQQIILTKRGGALPWPLSRVAIVGFMLVFAFTVILIAIDELSPSGFAGLGFWFQFCILIPAGYVLGRFVALLNRV